MDRKVDLERKKAKLAALRLENEKIRKENEAMKAQSAIEKQLVSAVGTPENNHDLDFEKMLTDMGISEMLQPKNVMQQPQCDTTVPLKLSISKIRLINVGYQASTTDHRATQTNDVYEQFSLKPTMALQIKAINTLPKPDMPVELQREKQVSANKSLTTEEKETIQLSKGFQNFVLRSGRLMERVLATTEQQTTTKTTKCQDETHVDADQVNTKLKLIRYFRHESTTRQRCITGLDCSPYYAELIVAGYHGLINEYGDVSVSTYSETDGFVLLWNMRASKQTSEDAFRCDSPVSSVCFASAQAQLILAGSHAGRVLLWDMRVPRRTPVQHTPLTPQAHVQPICGLRMLNNKQLMTLSNDGKLCTWNLDMLSRPLDTMQLQQKYNNTEYNIGATCLDLGDHNNLLVGSECGRVFAAQRPSGIASAYTDHVAPITRIETHWETSQCGHLFLSSSMDWSIKLWSTKQAKPLLTLPNNSDYVMDVAWSPRNAGAFAAAVGSGHLEIWDLNHNITMPIATVSIGTETDSAPNCLTWWPNGRHLAVGDAAGCLSVYELAEELAHPVGDEAVDLMHTLDGLTTCDVDDIDKFLSNV